MRQSKPLGLCFTCNGDHLKKSCPIELAKRGKINPVSMAELIEFDISLAEDIQGVDEIIQRFEVFLEADEEFTASRARQVAVVDLAGEECGELIARVMADHQVDEDDVETDEGPLEAINAAEEHKKLLDIIRGRRQKGLGTKVRDLLEDADGMVAMRRSSNDRSQATAENNGEGEGSIEITRLEEWMLG